MQGEMNMKKLRRLTAVLLSVLLVITIPAVTADAITVVKDGKSYTLKSVTPTTGDCNVLVIRVGFADYPVDGQVKPAHSEETLLSYFDGSGKSINGYYEASSYGKLRLHCEKVYSYNAQSEHEHYKDGNTVSEELLNETLNALKDEIDAEKYDSDGDGNLDFVCFDYAGPSTGWGTAWWSYVFSPDIIHETNGNNLQLIKIINILFRLPKFDCIGLYYACFVSLDIIQALYHSGLVYAFFAENLC